MADIVFAIVFEFRTFNFSPMSNRPLHQTAFPLVAVLFFFAMAWLFYGCQKLAEAGVDAVLP